MRDYVKESEWKKKKYKRILIDIPRETGEEFDRLLKENNQTRVDILLPVIEKYIEEHK